MFKKIKNWLLLNKIEILEVYSMAITALLVVVLLWAIIFTAISNDLVGVVDSKNTEIMEKNAAIEELTRQKLIAEMKADEIIQQYEDVILLGYYRILFNHREADKLVRSTGVDCFPVKSGNERKYFEYALNLDIKLKRKEYADFIRAISPLIADMFEIVLKKF